MSDFTSPSVKPSAAKRVAILGGTSGLGEALAKRYAEKGINVVVTGRRQERLDELAKTSDRIETFQWDLTRLDEIPRQVESLTQKYTDLNHVFIVAGLQRSSPFDKPDKLDFGDIDLEIQTNLVAPIRLIAAFLPVLSKRSDPVLAIVSSSLALLPAPRTPVYNGTKAGLHQTWLSIRQQLAAAKSPVTLLELYPPAVKTELHDTRNQPDLPGVDEYGGMEVSDWLDETWAGLEAGQTDIPVGPAKEQFDAIERPRRKLMADQAKK